MNTIDAAEENWIRGEIAVLAQQYLMPHFGRVARSRKADGSLLTEADTAMQAAIIRSLEMRFPGTRVLAEEQPKKLQQELLDEAGGSVWCVDPLDGTTNFASGMPLFAVSVALVAGGGVQFGLVHDPVRGETFSARRGAGARLNGRTLGQPRSPPNLGECVAVVDFKRLDASLATRLAVSPPFRSQRSLGSVALDWSWLAAGRFQLYLHGGQRLWDHAAGQLIAREAGAAVCLGPSVEAECGFTLSLDPAVAVGAADAGLFAAWRSWLAGR